MRTVAWLCCASLVSGNAVPARVAAAEFNADYSQVLEKASRESKIQEVEIAEEKTINNSADTVVDLSEHVGMYSKDITSMEWSVDFKTTDTGIQTLMSIGNSATNENDYMALYVSGQKVGFEFRGTSNFSKSVALSQTAADGAYHNLKLVVKTDSKFELYYDGNLVGTWDSGFVFVNNVSYTPDYFTVGGMKRYRYDGRDDKNWYFNGTIKNIYAQTVAPGTPEVPVEANLVYENEGITMNSGNDAIDVSDQLNALKGLEQGTVTVRYRAKDASQGLSALFSLSSTQAGRENSYAVMYVRPSNGTVGVEVRDTINGQTTNYNQSSKVASINNDYWHTVTYVFGKNSFTIYVDGEAVLQNNKTGFFNKISDPTAVKIGAMDRVGITNQWGFSGYIDKIQIWDNVLTEEQILPEHEATKQKETETETPEGVMKTEDEKLFYKDYDGSVSYRIPSLITTSNGTVIAGIDKRQSGAADTGNIDAVIRRSLDGGKTWQDPQTLIDLPKGGSQHSFSIDASMVEDKEKGRLFFIVDMFPESTALMSGDTINEVTSGYKEINGERYYLLTDADGNEYTIREKGQVYDADGNMTEYTVPAITNGTLYKSGNECGNIFLRTGDNAGELRAFKTSYLWMVYSDDDGATWSEPIDITKGIKKDWQLFFGTGPGVGIQMENGRLVVPVYYTNSVIGNSQSSAVIYSDDHGETWKCGESPNDGRNFNGQKLNTETLHNTSAMLTESQVVEVKDNNGKSVLKLFCRSLQGKVMIATSYDGGETWEDDLQQDAELRDPYCQMTVTPYPYEVKGLEGKQLFIFANPNAGNRSNGTVRLGYYDPDADQFVWPYSQVVYPGDYAYSCLSVIGEDNIGLFYEATVPNMMFTRFNTEWIIKGSSQVVKEDGPTIESITRDGNTAVLEASQEIFVMGNMTLKATINGEEQSLVYQSGSGTKKLVFALPENTPEDAEIVYDRMDDIHLLDKYYGNAQNQTFVVSGAEDLKKLVEEAEALNEADYSEGWETLQQKIAEAKAVMNQLNPSAEEITGAKTALQEAMDGLVVALVDKTALQTALDESKGENKENYSEKSWSRFETAVNKAQQVLEATNSTQSQVEEATQELIAAREALRVDKSALWAAIDKYSRYVQTEYEEEGWDTFVQALEDAKTTANTEGLVQSQVDASLKTLNDAAASLKALPKVDKTELRVLINECGSYKEVNYDETTWSVLQEVLQQAKNVSADKTVNQAAVEAAYTALQEAVSALNIVAGNVGGVVTDETGAGIEGVTISIGETTTTTNADGSYILNGIALGTSDVTADDDQYVAITESVTVEKEHAGVSKAVHNFVLQEAYTTIQGIVSAVGAPMAGLTVTLSYGDLEQTTVTNENGEYRFENVPTRDYVIQTAAEGYDAISKKIHVTKKEENVIHLMLPPKTQEGVADYTNEYEDGKVYWSDLAGTTGMSFANENGANVLHFPGGGHANAYEIKAPKFKNGCVEMDLTSVGQNGVRIGILLRAKDLNNRVYVGVGDAADQYFSEYWGSNGNAWSNMASGETFEAGKKMHLKAEIIDKTVTLWVNGEQVLSNTMENMPTDVGAIGLNCRSAKDVIVDNIKVTSYDETTGEAEDIAGRISSQGAAVVGAEVSLMQGEEVIAKAVTDELGNYKFKNIPYGTYKIKAVSGEISKEVEIQVQETDGYCVAPEIQLDQAEEPGDTVNKNALKIMIDKVNGLNEKDYSTASWEALQNCLADAEAVYASETATQEEVDQAYIDLVNAWKNLEVGLNTSAAEAVIKEAEAVLASPDLSEYRPSSVQAVRDALDAVKAALANPETTQEQLNDTVTQLIDALIQLQGVINADALQNIVDLAEELLLDKDRYTTDTVAALEEALEAAKAVIANGDRTQQQIDDAYEALTNAIAGLVVRGDKSVLEPLIEKAEEILANTDAYTSSSLEGLAEVFASAKEVYDDVDAVQTEINTAAANLAVELSQVRILGDVNNDQKVDTADAAEVLKVSAELQELSEADKDAADVKKDGIIDTADAALIEQYAAELITEF